MTHPTPPRLAACAILAVAAAVPACTLRTPASATRPPRGEEAELAVYLQPLPPGPLALDLAGVAVTRRDGAAVPLALRLAEISPSTASRQRLLAAGRIPAGTYTGLQVGVRRARLAAGDLALPPEPVQVPVELAAPAGRGQVVLVSLLPGAIASGAILSSSPFAADRAEPPAVPLLGLASVDELESVAVLDRRAHRVVGLLPTAPEPREIAVDGARQIAYVASSGGSRIQAFDLATFDELVPTRLRIGDRPTSLALVPDGTLLVVANSGSESVSLVDPIRGEERQRIDLRGEPTQVLVDRPGARAFVVLRRAAAVAIVGLGGDVSPFGAFPGPSVRTIPVEEQPIRALVSPAGDQLTVAYARAPFVTVHALPSGAPLGRIFTGPGVTALLRDPTTGWLVVASSDSRLQAWDPGTLLPVYSIPLPAPASRLAVDAAEGALLALMPERGSIAVIDLRARRIRAEIDVGPGTQELALMGAAR